MKVSELIEKLGALQEEHGDIEVYTSGLVGFTPLWPELPKIAYRKILSKRESRQCAWYTWEGEDKKGEKVISI